ncbi:hypothetical protein ACFQZR_16970 [Paenibacillus sp. GCM10027629]|uniref:hypothetical protein n=1 Tax=Paenibacillus sp. GCM10027629 TaxID=3273414 RepID=UPI00363CDADB
MSSTDRVNETESFTFGVFPLALAGGPDGVAAGPPDDFEQMGLAMKRLQGDGVPLFNPLVYNLDWNQVDGGGFTTYWSDGFDSSIMGYGLMLQRSTRRRRCLDRFRGTSCRR